MTNINNGNHSTLYYLKACDSSQLKKKMENDPAFTERVLNILTTMTEQKDFAQKKGLIRLVKKAIRACPIDQLQSKEIQAIINRELTEIGSPSIDCLHELLSQALENDDLELFKWVLNFPQKSSFEKEICNLGKKNVLLYAAEHLQVDNLENAWLIKLSLIQVCYEENDLPTVKKIIDRESGPLKETMLKVVLTKSCITGNMEALLLALDEKVTFQTTNVLDTALVHGNTEIAQILFDRGMRLEEPEDLLYQLCEQGKEKSVRFMAKINSIKTHYAYDKHPLLIASQKGHLQIVKILMEAGVIFEKGRRAKGPTPFSLAVVHGHQEIVRLFMGKDNESPNPSFFGTIATFVGERWQGYFAKGMNIFSECSLEDIFKNKNPIALLTIIKEEEIKSQSTHHDLFHQACCFGSPLAEKWSLDKSLINAVDQFRNTPLDAACNNGQLETVKMLLKRGAQPQVSNTPWNLTNHCDIALVLLEHDSSLLPRMTLNYVELFFHACAAGSTKIVELLLNQHVKVDRKMESKFSDFTPIDWALAHGQFHIVKQIVDHFGGSYDDLIEDKFLAHVYGIDGYSDPQPYKVDYEGFNRLLASQKLSHLASAFLDESKLELSKADREELKAVLQAAPDNISKKPEELVKDIDAGKPVILYTGWNTHINVIVFWKGLLIKCERGGASEIKGIEIFEITNKESLKDAISELQEKAKTRAGREFFTQGINTLLGLKKIDQIVLEKQPVGNCGWANSKAAFLALLYVLFLNKLTDNVEAKHSAITVYKGWSKDDVRVRVEKEYRTRSKRDDKLLYLMEEKKSKKSSLKG